MADARIQVLDRELIEGLIARAKGSARLRVNHNFHASMDDNPHRFLNVMVRGTYVAPHRHLDPAKAEAFVVLEGEVAFFTFEDDGTIRTAHVLGRDALGIDVAPGVWHTLAVLSEHAVCYEVKPGPYSAANDKDFAPWAPREGELGVAAYRDWLVSSLLREPR